MAFIGVVSVGHAERDIVPGGGCGDRFDGKPQNRRWKKSPTLRFRKVWKAYGKVRFKTSIWSVYVSLMDTVRSLASC